MHSDVRATVEKVCVELSRSIHNVFAPLCGIEKQPQQFVIATPVKICDVLHKSLIAHVVLGRVGCTTKTIIQVSYKPTSIALVVGSKDRKCVRNISLAPGDF